MKLSFYRFLGLWAGWVTFFVGIGSYEARADISVNRVRTGEIPVLRIDSKDLGKRFLLRGLMIDQFEMATGNPTRSKIVYFKIAPSGDRLFMMESPDGHVATRSVPSQLILAEFPIVRKSGVDSKTLEIDFASGMAQMYIAEGWYASDAQGKSPSIIDQALTYEVARSFITDQRKIKATGEVEIRQLIQARVAGGLLHPSFEMRYNLGRYAPTRGFESRENMQERYFRYFETPPIVEAGSGRETVNITRWHLGKEPIVYHISANTPPEYYTAVEEGILYWNKAFGREVLVVKPGTRAMMTRDSDVNHVLWIDNDKAHGAYAIGQADPLTGEMKRAKIVMTSIFAFNTKLKLQRVIRMLKDRKATPAPASHHHGSGVLCEYDIAASLLPKLEELATSNADDAAILRVSRAMIRSVIAHETGHTMGLRHNFSGKAYGNLTPKQLDEAFANYITNGTVPDPATARMTSSLMEYNDFQADVILGAQMEAMKEPLPHDRIAIETGYALSGKDRTSPKDALPFCTDTEVGLYEDCQRSGYGPNPIVHRAHLINTAANQLSQRLLEGYIHAKTAIDPRDRVPLEEVALDPVAPLREIAALQARQLRWLNSDTRSILIDRRFPVVDRLQVPLMLKEQLDWVRNQVEQAGGVDAVFFGFLPIQETMENTTKSDAVELPRNPIGEHGYMELQRKLEQYTEGGEGFVGTDGKPAHFTKEESALILERGKRYLGAIQNKLTEFVLIEYLNTLAQAPIDLESEVEGETSDTSLAHQFEMRIVQVAANLLFSKSDGDYFVGEYVVSSKSTRGFKVPLPYFGPKLRTLAAFLVSGKYGAAMDWSLFGRREIAKLLKKEIRTVFGIPVEEVQTHKIRGEFAREWFLTQVELIKILSSQGGCEDLFNQSLNGPQPKEIMPAIALPDAFKGG